MSTLARTVIESRTSPRSDELSAAGTPAIPYQGATFRCVLCEASDGSEMGPNPDFPRSRIAHCRNCGLMSSFPLPGEEELDAVYRQRYRQIRGEAADKNYLRHMDCRAEAQLAFLRRHSPTQLSRARILDVGCSAGSFLKACAGFTQSLAGFEPDDAMRAAARGRLPPAAVLHGTLFQAERLAGQTFDVIVASHVLEHVPQPGFFLSALCGSLAPGGTLLIEVPNEDSATVGNWIQSGERGGMHLFFFTPRTLRDIIEAAGGRVAHLATFGGRKDDSSLIVGDAAALKARLKSFVETSFGPAALGSARRLWKAWRGRARRRLMGIERGLSGEYLRVIIQKKLH